MTKKAAMAPPRATTMLATTCLLLIGGRLASAGAPGHKASIVGPDCTRSASRVQMSRKGRGDAALIYNRVFHNQGGCSQGVYNILERDLMAAIPKVDEEEADSFCEREGYISAMGYYLHDVERRCKQETCLTDGADVGTLAAMDYCLTPEDMVHDSLTPPTSLACSDIDTSACRDAFENFVLAHCVSRIQYGVYMQKACNLPTSIDLTGDSV